MSLTSSVAPRSMSARTMSSRPHPHAKCNGEPDHLVEKSLARRLVDALRGEQDVRLRAVARAIDPAGGFPSEPRLLPPRVRERFGRALVHRLVVLGGGSFSTRRLSASSHRPGG
eukprot:29317-Pelagococcus_subviridis.AAC.3